MSLSSIRSGQRVQILSIPDGALKERLRQFGFVEGIEVHCPYGRKNIIALSWLGTTIAARRKDLSGMRVRVME